MVGGSIVLYKGWHPVARAERPGRWTVEELFTEVPRLSGVAANATLTVRCRNYATITVKAAPQPVGIRLTPTPVRVKVTGDLELKEVRIDPDALGGGPGEEIGAEDLELLQDMVLAAVNEAIRSAQELANRKLGSLAGGLGELGGLGLPGL